jgi:hypothetical protein
VGPKVTTCPMHTESLDYRTRPECLPIKRDRRFEGATTTDRGWPQADTMQI